MGVTHMIVMPVLLAAMLTVHMRFDGHSGSVWMEREGPGGA